MLTEPVDEPLERQPPPRHEFGFLAAEVLLGGGHFDFGSADLVTIVSEMALGKYLRVKSTGLFCKNLNSSGQSYKALYNRNLRLYCPTDQKIAYISTLES